MILRFKINEKDIQRVSKKIPFFATLLEYSTGKYRSIIVIDLIDNVIYCKTNMN